MTLKGLRARAGRLAATGCSVALGVALLTGSMSLIDGIRQAQHDLSVGAAGAVDLVVESGTAFGFGEVTIPDEALAAVSAIEGVEAAIPTLLGWARLAGEDGSPIGGPLHSGIAASVEAAHLEYTPLELLSGRLPAANGEAAIDGASARKTGSGLGARVRILLPTGARDFEIVGTIGYDGGEGIAGASLVLFDLDTARLVLDVPAGHTSIGVVAAAGTAPLDLAASLAGVLPEGVAVVPVGESSGWGFGLDDRALAMVRSLLIVAAGIVLGSVALMVYGTFAILAEQRTREAALLRVIGATRLQIALRITGEAGLVSGAGAAIGVAAGAAIAGLVRSLAGALGWEFPYDADGAGPGTVVLGILVGLVVGIGAVAPVAFAVGRAAPLISLRAAGDPPLRLGRRGLGAAALAAGAGALLTVGAAGGQPLPVVVGGCLVLGAAVLALPILLGAAGRGLGRVRNRVAWRLATGGLVRRPDRAAAAATALTVSVALVSLLGTVAASVDRSILRAVQTEVSADLYLRAGGSWDPTRDGLPPEAAERIRALEEVEAVAEFRLGSFRYAGESANHALLGIDPEAIDLIDWRVIAGDLDGLSDGEVALRADRARSLGVGPGDRVALQFPDGRTGEYAVVALYEADFIQLSVAISMPEYDRRYGRALDYFVLVAAAPDVEPAVVGSAVREVAATFPGTEVDEVDSLGRELAAQAGVVTRGFTLLLACAALVGILAIVNSQALAISERRREIALLRVVGMTGSGVRRLVHLESVLLALLAALIGSLIGIPLGVAVAASVGRGLSASVPWGTVLLFPTAAAGAAALGAVWPARRTARIDVISAISPE